MSISKRFLFPDLYAMFDVVMSNCEIQGQTEQQREAAWIIYRNGLLNPYANGQELHELESWELRGVVVCELDKKSSLQPFSKWERIEYKIICANCGQVAHPEDLNNTTHLVCGGEAK